MSNTKQNEILNEVVDALRERGFEPWEQIKGYVELGDDSYITRRNDAREKIKQIDKEFLKTELRKRGL